jgi:lysine 2,3-aminomutase
MTAPAALWAGVAASDWADYRWQLRNQLRTPEALERAVRLTDEERRACALLADRFRLGVTPYYASLIDPEDPACPIRRQAIPTTAEARVHPDERTDPLAEERDMPVLGLTRRYPDRALLYVTHTCAVYCRHCTRRRKVSDPASAPPTSQIDEAIDWIAANPDIRDVVLSGGDPLTLPDAVIDRLLGRLRAIPHVEIVRIGSRNPT